METSNLLTFGSTYLPGRNASGSNWSCPSRVDCAASVLFLGVRFNGFSTLGDGSLVAGSVCSRGSSGNPERGNSFARLADRILGSSGAAGRLSEIALLKAATLGSGQGN